MVALSLRKGAREGGREEGGREVVDIDVSCLSAPEKAQLVLLICPCLVEAAESVCCTLACTWASSGRPHVPSASSRSSSFEELRGPCAKSKDLLVIANPRKTRKTKGEVDLRFVPKFE